MEAAIEILKAIAPVALPGVVLIGVVWLFAGAFFVVNLFKDKGETTGCGPR